MSRQTHERLMSEARAIIVLARAATWRASVTACQIEKLVPHSVHEIKIPYDNNTVCWIQREK
jgi:hypothetical protein